MTTTAILPNRKMCPKCEKYHPLDSYKPWIGQTYDLSPYCIPCNKEIDLARTREARSETLHIYGDRCTSCGNPDNPDSRYTKLELDHVDTDGYADRQGDKPMSSASLYRHIAALGHKDPQRNLQLLCKNCHDKKTFSTPGLENWNPSWRRSGI